MAEQGLSFQITFTPDKQLKRFLNDIPSHIGSSFGPEDIHTTIFYPEETARAGLGEQEKTKLLNASPAIAKAVGELGIVGHRLSVAPNILRPYKKFFGIEIIDEDGVCDDLRDIGATAINKATGVKLRSYLPTYHMSVARRNKGDGRRRPLAYRRHFPTGLTIAGISTGVKTVHLSNGHNEQYINDLSFCDPNRMYS